MSDEPFGRQPQPVTVVMTGDSRDVDYWRRVIMGHIERASYANCVYNPAKDEFTIYPGAVND